MSHQLIQANASDDRNGGRDGIAKIVGKLKEIARTRCPGGREITIKIFDDGNTFNQINIDVLEKHRGTFVIS